MYRLTFVLLSVFLGRAIAAEVNPFEEDLKHIKELLDVCGQKFPISEKAAEDLKKGLFPTSDPNIFEHVFCVEKGRGFVDDDGNVVQKNFPEKMWDEMPENCKQNEGADKFEKVKNVHECVLNVMRKYNP
uniref:Odorant binding protein 7 n=1 Tax=Agrilus mali TaxID=1917227 RepID=A0A2R4H1F6_9COLE|nr:odorant binding protein 7 [Agrilus mali]